jgi:hypothetical protein
VADGHEQIEGLGLGVARVVGEVVGEEIHDDGAVVERDTGDAAAIGASKERRGKKGAGTAEG